MWAWWPGSCLGARRRRPTLAAAAADLTPANHSPVILFLSLSLSLCSFSDFFLFLSFSFSPFSPLLLHCVPGETSCQIHAFTITRQIVAQSFTASLFLWDLIAKKIKKEKAHWISMGTRYLLCVCKRRNSVSLFPEVHLSCAFCFLFLFVYCFLSLNGAR